MTLINGKETTVNFFSCCRQLFILMLSLFAAQLAFAENNAIQSVDAMQQGGNVLIRIGLNKPVSSAPVGFSINNPARVVLDFADTQNETGKTSISVNLNDVKSLNIVQSNERSRVVLNLARPLSYTTSIEGNYVLIKLHSSDVQGRANTAPVAPMMSANTQPSTTNYPNATWPAAVQNNYKTSSVSMPPSIRDIDFRRGTGGEGRIIVDLTNPNTSVDVKQKGQSVVIDFMKTGLPGVLRRRLDVVDFGTPVNTVNTFPQGSSTRMVIESKGLWEHSVYQSEAQLVIDVKPLKVDPNKLVQGSQGYKGEHLTLNFQNIDVRSILQVIADFTGLNIITSDSVTGNLTLRLKDVPWDQALDVVMRAKNLDMRKNGTVLWIAPKDELLTKEKLELEAKAQIADLEPLITQSFQLNYQKAEDFKKAFGIDDSSSGGTSNRNSILSKRGSAVMDPRTNQLFVTDTASRLAEIEKLIAKTDVPSRQVLIEARIVEADDQYTKNLGARLAFGFQSRGSTQFELGGQQTGENADEAVGLSSETLRSVNGDAVTLPSAPIPSRSEERTVAFTLLNAAASKFLNLELSALIADGKGKIISSPRVATSDQLKAVIEQGTELPYQQATSSGATSIAFRKANLRLEVTPQITPEGNVILNVDVNKDSVGSETVAGFAINTKHVQTTMLVENGGTVVLGGIYTQTERENTRKVPFFGDLPLFGHLFKNNSKTNDKTELLIFITPKVLNEKLSVNR